MVSVLSFFLDDDMDKDTKVSEDFLIRMMRMRWTEITPEILGLILGECDKYPNLLLFFESKIVIGEDNFATIFNLSCEIQDKLKFDGKPSNVIATLLYESCLSNCYGFLLTI